MAISPTGAKRKIHAKGSLPFEGLVLAADELSGPAGVEVDAGDDQSRADPGLHRLLELPETRLYAPCQTTPKDRTLRAWLNNFLDRLPGFCVFVHERR